MSGSWIAILFDGDRLDELRALACPPTRLGHTEEKKIAAEWRLPDTNLELAERLAPRWEFALDADGVRVGDQSLFEGEFAEALIDDNPEHYWDSMKRQPRIRGPRRAPFAIMVHWAREREAARVAREAGLPPPWSTDPFIGGAFDSDGFFLPGGRFCNVRRSDDVVTRWIVANIAEPFAAHQHLWLMLTMARLINRPATLAELIAAPGAWPVDDAFSLERAAEVIDARIARGEPAWTAAYTVPAVGKSHRAASWSKARQIFGLTVADLWSRRSEFEAAFARGAGLAEVHGLPTRATMVGPFLGYQAIVDMRFTALLRDAPDVATWAGAGPGTIRGLNRLSGRDVDADLSQQQARTELVELYPRLRAELPDIDLDLSDCPNICCEYDKYCRVKNGEGVIRAKYIPAGLRSRVRPAAKRPKPPPKPAVEVPEVEAPEVAPTAAKPPVWVIREFAADQLETVRALDPARIRQGDRLGTILAGWQVDPANADLARQCLGGEKPRQARHTGAILDDHPDRIWSSRTSDAVEAVLAAFRALDPGDRKIARVQIELAG